MGKAWRRFHSCKGAPAPLLEAHAALLCQARDFLLPHVGQGAEAQCLLDLLRAVAVRKEERPAVVLPGVGKGKGKGKGKAGSSQAGVVAPYDPPDEDQRWVPGFMSDYST